MVRVLMNPRKRPKSQRRSSPPSSTSKRRRNPSGKRKRRRNPFGKRSKRRRNPFGGGGIVATAMKGAGVVGGMIGAEFLGRILYRRLPLPASMQRYWLMQLVAGLGGAWLARKAGFGKIAGPLALGGVVTAAKSFLDSQNLNGTALALRSGLGGGLGDYVTTESGDLSGAEYGILGIGAPPTAELMGIGLGDYVTGEPAWAEG